MPRKPILSRAATRRLLASGALLLLAAFGASQLAGAARDTAGAIEVTARAVPLNARDPAQTEIGRLRYLGGLELRSSDSRFGGISGLRFLDQEAGTMLAVSDDGHWFRFTAIERDDRLIGVEGVTIAPLIGPDNRPIRGKAEADAEALEVEADGLLRVAFERNHRLLTYRDPAARARFTSFPDSVWLGRLPNNEGLEAIAQLPGAWLYLAEADEPEGGYNGVLQPIGNRTNAYGRIRFEPADGFRPTDAAALDDRTVAVLQRRFSPLMGVAASIQLLEVDSATLTAKPGPTIATWSPPIAVDNMEGLAVRRAGDRRFLYVISDDNFSPLQRTLLLKFELTPDPGK